MAAVSSRGEPPREPVARVDAQTTLLQGPDHHASCSRDANINGTVSQVRCASLDPLEGACAHTPRTTAPPPRLCPPSSRRQHSKPTVRRERQCTHLRESWRIPQSRRSLPVRPQNGEIFDGLDVQSHGLDVQSHENDGQKLFSAFQAGPSILSTLRNVEGPYAFVYYEHATQTLYWGRDPLGRRSLMHWRANAPDRNFSLTSIAPAGQDGWSEVDTSCVFSLALSSWQEARHPRLHMREAAGQPEAQVSSSLSRLWKSH